MKQNLKLMTESAVFNYLNSNNRVNNTIMNILTRGTQVTTAQIGPAFASIKLYKYPLRPQVIEHVEQGKIIMMYSPKDIKMSPALPFFLHKNSSGETRAIVIVDIHGSADAIGNVTIDPKKLYAILEAAYLAVVYANNHKSINAKSGVIKNGSIIYANMFARVLNRKYALNSDKVKLHKVQFLASKFFLINVLGHSDTETITNYAMSNCVGANTMILNDVNDIMKEEDYKDLATFISALKKPELHLNFGESLTSRSFIEQFIMTYDHSTLLSLELFPYFMFTVNAVVMGAYLNNQLILEDIVDKYGIKLYQEMLTASRN